MSEDNKVYVVTSGEYSDYQVDCILRTKEEAGTWVSKQWKPHRYEINEWEFETVNPERLYPFSVFLHMGDGSVESGWNDDCHEGPAIVSVRWRKNSCSLHPPDHAALWVRCLAKNRDHAIKIASEYRRVILASPLYDKWLNSLHLSTSDFEWYHNDRGEGS